MLWQGLDPARTLLLHDRLDMRTRLPNKQVRAALALICAGLEYKVTPCYGAEEKSFLSFPNAPSNACLTFDSRSLASVVKRLRSRSSDSAADGGASQRDESARRPYMGGAADPGHAMFLTNDNNEFRFRTPAEQQSHDERMNRVEVVGDHVIFEKAEGGGEEEGRRQTMALPVHIPNQFANGRWSVRTLFRSPLRCLIAYLCTRV